MEQLNNQNKWYRFPIDLHWKADEDLGIEPEAFESFYDIRMDSIVGWRPEHDKDKGVCGTFVYLTSGDSALLKIKPSTLRKLLNYEPEIITNDYSNNK